MTPKTNGQQFRELAMAAVNDNPDDEAPHDDDSDREIDPATPTPQH